VIGKGNRSSLSEHLALLSILIGVLFWIGESLVHVLAYPNRRLIDEILNPNPHEIANRVVFLLFIILFGFLAQTLISKRRQVEEVLQESERKYRVIFDTLTDIVFSLDIQGRISYLNPQFERISGYRAEDLYGRPYTDIISPDFRELTLDMFRRGISGEDNPMYEIEIVAADGRKIPIEVNARTVFDDAGRPVGRIGIARDMIQRKEVEMALRESEEKFRVLAGSTPTAIMLYQNNKWTYANPAAEKISGYSADELRSMNFWDIVHPDFKHLVQQRGQKRQQGESAIQRYEFKILSKQGKDLWVDLSGASTMLGGSPAGIISVIDINERKLAEEALRESEIKYRTILENIREGYFELDVNGQFTFFNDSLCKIFAYPREKLLGFNSRRLVSPLLRKKIDRVSAQIYKTGRSEEIIDLEILKGDESTGIIEMSLSPIQDTTGTITGFRGIARDVTERKRLEAQLLQAQKMEAIGTLAGGIAHDFNNLLMAIQGNVSLMGLDMSSDDTNIKRVKHIEQCIRSGSDLTKQLLGFARGGKYEVKPTDLNKLIVKTSEMFGHAKKEIMLHKKFQEQIWSVEVDQGQVEQVLLNLYVNAWHAMPMGGELFIETMNMDLDELYVKSYNVKPGRYVKISVTDTGIGMDEATRQRIFEPFFTTKDKSRGSGLGLASAYGIIHNHEGFISVYSELGSGTTFNIYLPASDKAIPEKEERKYTEIIRGSENILLIDDEDMIIEIGSEILQTLGYRVLAARNGHEAIEMFREHKAEIDIVILDMIMPGISGAETYDRIKAMDNNVKVILSSGYSLNGDAAQILKRGCNGFIQKPFDIMTLSKIIRETIS
jgi:two-component system, cell cycle sensor histidine kinase and response regulator CckA